MGHWFYWACVKDRVKIQVQFRGWAVLGSSKGRTLFLPVLACLDFGVWRAKVSCVAVEQDGRNSHEQDRI